MLKKLIFFLAWVGIFILSFLGIVYSIGHIISPNFPAAQLAARGIVVGSKMSTIMILWISVLYMIVCILRIHAKVRKEKNYEIQNENGIVSVSPQIVTNCVKDLLSDDDEIKNIKVDAVKNGKKFDLLIRTEMATDDNIANKSMEIQNKIKGQLSKKIGIDIGSVEVKLSKLLKKAEHTPKIESGSEKATERSSYQEFEKNDDPEKSGSKPKVSFLKRLFGGTKKENTEKVEDTENTDDGSTSSEEKNE